MRFQQERKQKYFEAIMDFLRVAETDIRTCTISNTGAVYIEPENLHEIRDRLRLGPLELENQFIVEIDYVGVNAILISFIASRDEVTGGFRFQAFHD